MSTVTPTVSRSKNGDIVTITYTNMTTTKDTGSPIEWTQWADRSVQVIDGGTGFGVGGNIQWQGSNDGGTTWAQLNDPQGTALDFAAAKILQVSEITQLARPFVSAGDGDTDLDVIVVLRRAQPARV